MMAALPAAAHLTPNSEVRLAFGRSHVEADVVIPMGDYALASGNRPGNDPASRAAARTWLSRHIAAASPDGTPWRVAIDGLRFAQVAGPPDLLATLRLLPPPRADARRLNLRWSAVIDSVSSHFVLIVATEDFAAGLVGRDRQVLGALQGERRELTIDRGAAAPLAGMGAAVRLGMHHIAEGHDHLLFLIALLLPAPIVAAGRRWNGPKPVRATLWSLASVVTAFTVGHSMTLIGAALLNWQLPAQPVEVLIALSILISAIHALRPIFPGREALVAGGFGLVHGLAFATLVSGYGLDASERALTILGFNLGIELIQLLVVAAVAPSLLLIARTPAYPALRNLGALFAGVAAIAWVAERVSGMGNPVAEGMDALLTHGPWLIGGLLLLALVLRATLQHRRSVA
jgi:hypothetical protein